MALAAQARFEIPWTLSRLIGPPPTSLMKGGGGGQGRSTSTPNSPSRKRGERGERGERERTVVVGERPMLPSPRKLDPLVL